MTAKQDRSTFLPARIFLVSALLLFGTGIFSGCEKTSPLGPDIGLVQKGSQRSTIKLGSVILNEDVPKSFSLKLYHPKSQYPYGSISFYKPPLQNGTYPIEPKMMDSLSGAYILDSVFCTSYIELDVDAIDGFFRLIPDHPINDFCTIEVNTTSGRIKGTFSLAFERDPFLTNPILRDSSELNEVVIFTEGSFDFRYK